MSYGTICSFCLLLLAIWTSPKAKLSTVDCLEADRLEFYYRIAAQVQRNCVSKLVELCMVSTDWLKHCIVIAVQKSCIHASAAVVVFVEWWIVYCVGMVDSSVCVCFCNFSFMTAPRHQHRFGAFYSVSHSVSLSQRFLVSR